MKQKIAVVGSGIAGLVCGYELEKKGFEVTIFEADKSPGGRVGTKFIDGLAFDYGASFMMDSYDRTYKLLKELKLLQNHQTPTSITGPTMIFKNGKLINYSPTLKYLSFASKLKLLAALAIFVKDATLNNFNYYAQYLPSSKGFDNESVWDYFLRTTNLETVQYFLDPGIRCVDFHSSKEISKETFLALFKNGFPKYGLKNFTKIPHYVGKLSEVLASKLNIQVNSKILEITKTAEKYTLKTADKKYLDFDKVILATTPKAISQIQIKLNSAQKQLLNSAKLSSSISISFRIPKNLFSKYYLVMVPFFENEIIASYTNERIKGENYFDDKFSTVLIYLHEEAISKLNLLSKTDKEIFNLVAKELIKVCPDLANELQQTKKTLDEILLPHGIQRWNEALAKYPVGYPTLLKEFWEKDQGKEGLFFAGDWLGGPWIEGCVTTGQEIAGRVGV